MQRTSWISFVVLGLAWGLAVGVANAQTGACCTGVLTCTLDQEFSCAGEYQGSGSVCDPNPCPVNLTPFIDPLPIPPVAEPVVGSSGGAAHYEIRMTRGDFTFHSELPPTMVWSYEGIVPGPTIEARAGEEVTVNWIDDLRTTGGAPLFEHDLTVDVCIHGADVPEAVRTVVHLHGAHTFAQFDGHPELWSTPGAPGDLYRYPNDQLPTLLWYHDHALGVTRLNVTMGLAGFFILRDDFEESLGLPSGEFEVPLILMDRSFHADGSFDYPEAYVDRFFGDKMLVNGAIWPFMNVKQGKYRLRVLNGSNSRHITFNFMDGASPLPVTIIGTDGGLLSVPSAPVDSFTLGIAERTDVIIDFSGLGAGTEVLLENSLGSDLPQIMKFIVQGEGGFTEAIPASLRTVTPLDISGVPERTFVLRRETTNDMCGAPRPTWLINGMPWTEGPVDPAIDPVRGEMPELGSTEIWRFANATGMVHPMHMHLLMFQVLDRHQVTIAGDGTLTIGSALPLTETEMGWKDTVQVGSREVVRVAAKFEDFTGTVVDSKEIGFVYHCHILEHEDLEMMRQFNVVTTCGDGEKGPEEECDDGDVVPGDACSDTCTWENTLELVGLPQGGSVEVTINSQLVDVTTSLGESATDVAFALALAIESDSVLMGAGVTAFVEGDRVVVSDPITSSLISDPGLGSVPVIDEALDDFEGYPIQVDAQGTREDGGIFYALRNQAAAVIATAAGPAAESSSIDGGGSWLLATVPGAVDMEGNLVGAEFPGIQSSSGILSNAGETGPFRIFFQSARDLMGASYAASVRDSAATVTATVSLRLRDTSGNEVETPAAAIDGVFASFAGVVPDDFTEGDVAQFDPTSVAGAGLTFRSTVDPAPMHAFEIEAIAIPEPDSLWLRSVALLTIGCLAVGSAGHTRRARRPRVSSHSM